MSRSASSPASGFSCSVCNADDADTVSLVAASGVTLISLDGLVLDADGAATALVHRGSDAWIAMGRHST